MYKTQVDLRPPSVLRCPPYYNNQPKMKSFVCVVLLAAAVASAPVEESKRDKRGFLHGSYSIGSYDHGHHDLGLSSHYIGGLDLGHSSHYYDHAPVYHAPIHKVVHVKKVVEIPKVVEVKKVISVPKIISVPQVVKVSKIVEEPHYSHYSPSISHGWW